MDQVKPTETVLSKPPCKMSPLRKDAYNICVLLFLYFLQGIPLGFASVIPYMLQGDKSSTSYETLANFSWVTWPFSLKLAWAPIIDSLYIKRFGRRKSWLIPVQYALGIDLIFISQHIHDWFQRPLDEPWGPVGAIGPIKIFSLTSAFLFLTFLAATQDIVVDGWALTMLSKENVGWASTCNTVGQVAGNLVSFMIFLALESPEVSNNYLRITPIPKQGIVTASGFFFFWGVVFIIATTIVAIVKREKEDDHQRKTVDENKNNTLTLGQMVLRSDQKNHVDGMAYEFQIDSEITPPIECAVEKELGLFETYLTMFGVLKLPPILVYIAMQFLVKFAYSTAENLPVLKLIENGASKEKLVFMNLLLLPLQIFLPLFFAKWSNGPKPLSLFSHCVLPRLVIALLAGPLVYSSGYFRTAMPDTEQSMRPISPVPESIRHISMADFTFLQSAQTFNDTDHIRPMKYTFSTAFYAIIFANGVVYVLTQHPMFVAQMSFNAKISDPLVGGTYMTLLNTVCNLAGTFPSTLVMYFVDPLTSRSCVNVDNLKAGLASLSIVNNENFKVNGSPLSEPTIKVLENLGSTFLKNKANCKPMAGIEMCEQVGGNCVTYMDGFYFELVLCGVVGILSYFLYVRRKLAYLDSLPKEAFRFKLKRKQSLPTKHVGSKIF